MNNPVEPQMMDHATYEVRRRRLLAFLIDWAFIILISIPVSIVIFVLGLLTFSVGWMLYAIMFPLIAIPYIAFTIGGPQQASIGMRMMDIIIRRDDGKLVDPLLAVVHGILFWAIHVIGTPLLAIASLFTDRKRLLHDLLLGTVVTRP